MQSAMRDPQTIGPYRIVAEIARGRLASIHLATRNSDRDPSSAFAIKRVLPELAQVSGWGELLADEALLLSSIRHPNVVACHGSGRDDGHYVALEYVDGDSLQGLLAGSGAWRQPRLLLPVIADVLRGLAAVHSALAPDGAPLRVVHQAPHARHILVGSDGVARIADFTQARVQRLALGSCRAERLRGGLLAPEQALHPDSVDVRADLFVLGATLWEGLTGESLAKLTPAQVARTSADAPIPKPSSLGFAPPAYFDELCLRALERDPHRRFSSADEMLEELQRATRRAGAVAQPSEIGQWVRTTCARRGKRGVTTEADGSMGARAPTARGLAAIEVTAAPDKHPSQAAAESSPDAAQFRVKATRATMIGMPPVEALLQNAPSLPPQAALEEQPPPAVTAKPSAQAMFSKTLLGTAKVPGRLETTLQGGATSLGSALEPIKSEPPAFRREVAQSDRHSRSEEPRASVDVQVAFDSTNVLEPAREWSSVHDTRWVDFAIRSRQQLDELAELGKSTGSSAPPARIEQNLGERFAAWVGTGALITAVLLLGDFVMPGVQRWPDAPTLESVSSAGGRVAGPLGGGTMEQRGEASSEAPGVAIGRGATFAPQPHQLSPQSDRPRDAGTTPSGARLGRVPASPTTVPSRVMPPHVAPPRVPSPRVAPTSVAPTSAAPTSTVPTSAVPTSAAPTSAAPTSAVPTSVAPTSAAPVSEPPAVGVVPRAVTPAGVVPPPRGVPAEVAPRPAAPQDVAPPSAAPQGLGPTRFVPRRSTPSGVAPAGASSKPGAAVPGQPSLPANPY
ncbi:MAG: hypothetical protein RLZZ450_6434 [Pseudomonadota bacterium]|jgi:hypothetical protein